MRVLDLFSGIGGFSLGLERAGMETVAFCEYDKKCRQVLKKHWPDVPQYEDVRTLTKEQLDNDGITDIGLICGGYPCQPFSTAGKRQGEADDRALWKEYFRLVKEIRPTWVIAENVAGHISMGIDNVLADLEGEDYAVQTFVIPACAVDAWHRRDRAWIIAHTDRHGRRERFSQGEVQRQRDREIQFTRGFERWPGRSNLPAPTLCGAHDGVPGKVDRLKQLGNAVVPQIPEMIGRAINDC